MDRRPDYRTVYAWAHEEADRSGLPGQHHGPADAYRHILGIAEATRRYGALPAFAAGEANERLGGDTQASAAMDRANNEIGSRIGRSAKSRDEIIRLARAEIAAGYRAGGSGAAGTSVWLPPDRWRSKSEPLPEDNWPPRWKDDAGSDAARILSLPVEDWSEDDVRAVQRSRIYWKDGDPGQAEAFDKVRRWFERSPERRRNRLRTSYGPVTVDPYTRADGTKVEGHSRRAPTGR